MILIYNRVFLLIPITDDVLFDINVLYWNMAFVDKTWNLKLTSILWHNEKTMTRKCNIGLGQR